MKRNNNDMFRVNRAYLGIDPGKETGFAFWDPYKKKITSFGKTDFWGVVDLINFNKNRGHLIVVIEDPNLNKSVFEKKGVDTHLFGDRESYHKKREKIAQNVGMNKEQASLLIEHCRRNNIEFEAVRPVSKKWTATLIKSATGIKEKMSQHTRDAIKLVIGRI